MRRTTFEVKIPKTYQETHQKKLMEPNVNTNENIYSLFVEN